MSVLMKSSFEKAYRQLLWVTIEQLKSGEYDTTEISFNRGIWFDKEGYKKKVWTEGRKELHLNTWQRASAGTIIKCVQHAFEVIGDDKKKQNLVSNENYIQVMIILSDHTDQAAQILKDLYLNAEITDEECFTRLARLFGKRMYDPFSVIAYLFFLKDKDRYVPLRKEGYKKRLPVLDVKGINMDLCTWITYEEIISLMKQLQAELQGHFQETIELIDAQSFFWMLYQVNPGTPEYEYDTANDEETIVSGGHAEGNRIQYYVTRYERDPRNRKAAIELHGCKCHACGFDFEKFYGPELGKGFIEVHHIKPLSSYDEVVNVNPETDLVCLCSNCHRMVHHRKNAIVSVEELKQIIADQKK